MEFGFSMQCNSEFEILLIWCFWFKYVWMATNIATTSRIYMMIIKHIEILIGVHKVLPPSKMSKLRKVQG